MELAAQIVGITAVLLFALSYQPKKRSTIIALNATSRVLYVIQYIMLGAFAGAILDVVGLIAAIIVGQKDKFKHHRKLILILTLLTIVIIGGCTAVVNQNIIDILPIFGVCLQISALWASDTNRIRKLSLIGSPCWLVYNVISKAYGSVLGDIAGIISIIIALLRKQ